MYTAMDTIRTNVTTFLPAPHESASLNSIPKKRLLLLSAILFFIVLLSTVLTFHAYIAWAIARPQIDSLVSNPKLSVGLDYHDIHFQSINGRSELSGWYIPNGSDQTVIFSHGYGGNREEIWVPIYELAKALHERDYNVLMFDYAYVSDQKGIVTGGVHESQQLLGAVQYAMQQGAQHVYIWGFSMGAGTALQAALISDDISGMILDSTFLLESSTLYANIQRKINVPKYPSLPLIRLFFPILNGVHLNQVPAEKVKNAHYSMPIFMIHGDEDLLAPYEIAAQIAANQTATGSSNFWLLPGGTHELLYRQEQQLYMQHTLDFLKAISER